MSATQPVAIRPARAAGRPPVAAPAAGITRGFLAASAIALAAAAATAVTIHPTPTPAPEGE